jgi:hypothetical protein
VAALPKSQREVLTMLKVNDSSIEEVARATSGRSAPSSRRPTGHRTVAQFAGAGANRTTHSQESGAMTALQKIPLPR